jgi:hypothetical protein
LAGGGAIVGSDKFKAALLFDHKVLLALNPLPEFEDAGNAVLGEEKRPFRVVDPADEEGGAVYGEGCRG